jgi:hypothetical protein
MVDKRNLNHSATGQMGPKGNDPEGGHCRLDSRIRQTPPHFVFINQGLICIFGLYF